MKHSVAKFFSSGVNVSESTHEDTAMTDAKRKSQDGDEALNMLRAIQMSQTHLQEDLQYLASRPAIDDSMIEAVARSITTQLQGEHHLSDKGAAAERAHLEEQLRTKEAALKTAHSTIERHQDTIQKLKDKVKILNQMIIHNSQSDEASAEDSITHEFGALKQDISHFVHSQTTQEIDGVYYRASKDPDVTKMKPAVFHTFKSLSHSRECQFLWIRGFIAQNVWKTYFSPPYLFGFVDPILEEKLQRFEDMLVKSPGVDRKDIDDWRARTVRMAGITPKNKDEHVKDIFEEAKFMVDVLRPILKNRTEATQSLRSIYQRAFEIALMLRRTTIRYTWTFDPHRADEYLEVVGENVHESVKEEHSVLDFVVFGAVLKAVDVIGEEMLVLCKADIVVRHKKL